MDAGVLDMITNVGFPIVCTLGLAWYVKDSRDKEREMTEKINQNHTQEMIAYKNELSEVIKDNIESVNKNTEAINKLVIKLDEKLK